MTGSAHFGADVGIQAEFVPFEERQATPIDFTIDAENLDMLDRVHLSSDHDLEKTQEERGTALEGSNANF